MSSCVSEKKEREETKATPNGCCSLFTSVILFDSPFAFCSQMFDEQESVTEQRNLSSCFTTKLSCNIVEHS